MMDDASATAAAAAALRWCPSVRAAVLGDAVARGDRAAVRRWTRATAEPRDLFTYFVAAPGSAVALANSFLAPPGLSGGRAPDADCADMSPALVACAVGDTETLRAAVDQIPADEFEEYVDLEDFVSVALRSGRAETVRALAEIVQHLGMVVELPLPVECYDMGTCDLVAVRAAVETGLARPATAHELIIDALRTRAEDDDDGGERSTADKIALLVEHGVRAFPGRLDVFGDPEECVFAYLADANDPAGLAVYLRAVSGREPRAGLYDNIGRAAANDGRAAANETAAWVRASAPEDLVPEWLHDLLVQFR